MSLLTLAAIAAHTEDDLVVFFKTQSTAAESAAVHAAKAIIALVDKTGSEKTARAALKKGGAAEYAVKNSLQLVWAYDDVVRPGHADEAWFDSLLYLHAVAVRRAVKVRADKKGIMPGKATRELAEAGFFRRSARQNLFLFEATAEDGLTPAEREAAPTVPAAAAPTAPVTAPATEETAAATAAATEETAPTVTVAGSKTTKTPKEKPPVTPLDEVLAELDHLDKILDAVVPGVDDVAAQKMRERLAQSVVRANALFDRRAAAAKAA